MSPKRLAFILLILFSTVSFIKLLIITSTASDAAHRRVSPTTATATATATARRSTWDFATTSARVARAEEDLMTAKEYDLVKNHVAKKAPCRLLVFGATPQLLELARLNRGGATAFLDDGMARGADRELGDAVEVYRVEYRDAAREAYRLLKHARARPETCRPTAPLRNSRCGLELAGLPAAVLDATWDVVVVDGPSGAGPDEPGRMAAIYTAAAMARAAADVAGAADVFVHNVDRTIERWYAWEFLCDENLVAAKGRLWHFRIRTGGSNSEAFCAKSETKIQ